MQRKSWRRSLRQNGRLLIAALILLDVGAYFGVVRPLRDRARSGERDLLRFLTRLESSEYFRDVLPRTESSTSAETPNEYVSINLTVRYVGGSPKRNGSRRSSP